MKERIVRLEKGMWCIRSDAGELHDSEQKELIEYFNEIKLPYRLSAGRLYIDGGVDRNAVFERLQHFYDGRAEVFPF